MKGPCPTHEKPAALCGWCDFAEQCESAKRRAAEEQARKRDELAGEIQELLHEGEDEGTT